MNKKFVKVAVICAAIGSLAIGGTMAYLTDYDSVVNEFTVGEVKIDLEEPNWKPEENKKIEPTQVIKKDPQIKNSGVSDAYVYLEVEVPRENVIVANAAGQRQAKAITDLFTYTVNPDWTMIAENTNDQVHRRTYCYNKVLASGSTTNTLFDTVTMANVIEGQIDKKVLTVPVRAYAIQTVNTGAGNTVVAKATEAFKKYYAQNEGTDAAAKQNTNIKPVLNSVLMRTMNVNDIPESQDLDPEDKAAVESPDAASVDQAAQADPSEGQSAEQGVSEEEAPAEQQAQTDSQPDAQGDQQTEG